jgi:hypothetical protein
MLLFNTNVNGSSRYWFIVSTHRAIIWRATFSEKALQVPNGSVFTINNPLWFYIVKYVLVIYAKIGAYSSKTIYILYGPHMCTTE